MILIKGAALLFLLRLISCSAPHNILKSEEYLKLILVFITKDAQIRKVAKVFKNAFDEACSVEVLEFDPRLKALTEISSQYQQIPVQIPVQIPAQIPLLYLLQEFIGRDLTVKKAELDMEFPLVQVVKGTKRANRQKKRKLRNDFDRFSAVLTDFILNSFNEEEPENPQGLFRFYRLLRLSLPQKDFESEIFPSLNFPLEQLLKYAVRGSYSDQINRELLVEFKNYLPADFIFEAFEHSQLDLVKIMLTFPRADKMVTVRDDKQRVALHYAAHFGDIDLVRKCLELDTKVNKFDSKREKAIHKAAANGHLDVVRFLYESGSAANSQKFNPSPILNAVKRSHFEVVRFILNETNFISIDSSKNTKDFNYKLLAAAIKNNNTEMVSLLINSDKLSFEEEQIQKFLTLTENTMDRASFLTNTVQG